MQLLSDDSARPRQADQLCAGLTSYRRELQLHTHDTYLRIECLLTLGLCTTNRALQPSTRSLQSFVQVVTLGPMPMCLVLRQASPRATSRACSINAFAYGACSFAAVRKLSARFSSSATGASAAASSLSTRERSSSLDSDAVPSSTVCAPARSPQRISLAKERRQR